MGSHRKVGGIGLAVIPLLLGLWAWRVATWRPHTVRVSSSTISALAWARDGGTLRCASEEGYFRVLASATLKTAQVYGDGKGWRYARFSEDGSTLLACLSDAITVEKWSCSPFKRLWKKQYEDTIGELENPLVVNALALSAHGKDWAIVRTSARQGEAEIWESPREGATKSETKRYSNYAPYVVSFSEQGTLLAQSDAGPGFAVWERATHKTLWDAHTIWPGVRSEDLSGSGFDARALCFSPDDKWLAASLSGGATILFGAKTGKKYPLANDVKSDDVLAFSPNSRFLAGGDDKGNVDIWDVDSRQWVRTLRTGFSPITALAFSPDGAHIAIGKGFGQVQVWRLK